VQLVLVNGLIVGCIYGVFALGLTLVYKGSRVVNFAQGDFGMVGAFVLLQLYGKGDVPVGVALLAALATATVLAVLTERLVVRRLVGRPVMVAFAATLGVGALLQLAAQDLFNPGLQYFPPLVAGVGIHVGGLFVSPSQLLVVAVTAAVTLATYLLYSRTRLGLQVRAVAQNPAGATLLGVDSGAVSTATWAVGGLLSGIAAVLIAPLVTFQLFFMFFLLARALAAALLGGLTSLVGAFAGGIAVGLAEAVVTRYTSVAGGVEIGLLVIVLVLLVARPRGLFAMEY